MHRFDEDMSIEEIMDIADEAYEELDKLLSKLTDKEGDAYGKVAKTIEEKNDYDEDFFDKSANELSKHFNVNITENVRKALKAKWKWIAAEDDTDELIDEMAGDEEE